MPAPNAIIALSELELADFFPGSMRADLAALLPAAEWVHPPFAAPSDWVRLWRERPAEILVSAWQTPPLNGPLGPADLQTLKYVCYVAGSVRKLVPRELVERGLLVTNWGSSISATVAECALMLILMSLRRASYWATAMHRDGVQWKDASTRTQSLIGRRVGLHGFGVISQHLVPMLQPFTSDIATFSPSVPDGILARHGVRRAPSLEDLFANSDVLVELAAATPSNCHLVQEKHLRLIPPGGVFVNVGRGSVVDEDALARVAREGDLQVALDVYDREPLPLDSPFRGMPNVTLLPHLGGPTRDRRRDAGALALKNLRAYLNGEAPEAVVTSDVYDRST